jgi:alkylresorcinol/alkylpyrone synthase
MGWDMVDSGFKIVLSGNVPEIVKENVGKDVDKFLATRNLSRKEIKNIISHPGGPKVLKALAEVLEFPDSAFQHSWDSLRDNGNLSSVSVLNVLERSLKQKLQPGPTLALAMGPAFNSELLLLEAK